jgi:phosphate/sulfate permease
MRSEIRWTLGCLVSAAALVGALIIVLLVTLALQPPEWVQVLVGIALVGGGAVLAWLVASALGRSRFRGTSRNADKGPSSFRE